MNIEAILSIRNSKKDIHLLVDYIIENPSSIERLMRCFFSKELRTCQYAAWPLGILGSRKPQMLYPYIEQMITHLKTPKHNAVIRNTLRTWQEMEIPEKYEGLIFEICFNYLVDPNYAIAIRAFSIAVASNIASKYPDLAQELKAELLNQLNYPQSAGIKYRLKKYSAIL